MPVIDIPYGRGMMPLHLPQERLLGVLRPAGESMSLGDPDALVRAALENPVASPRLSELARGKARVLVITSDHTRPVPSRVTMPPLLAEIRRFSPAAEVVPLLPPSSAGSWP